MAFCEKYMRFVIVVVTIGSIVAQNCLSLLTDGYTVPQGDIVLQYGQDLNITCNLHKNIVDKYGPNASSRLYFKRNNMTLPQDMIKIVNSTSIQLHIAEHPKTKDDNYYCYFRSNEGDRMLCMNVVMVGVAPQNVTDFSCISKNYDNLTCTWTRPNNYLKTDYNLTYYLKSRPARFRYSCPEIKLLDNGQASCFWNLSTLPQYRPVHECYYFAIGMNNTYGSNVNYYTFEHFKHVLPSPPENLTAVATSPHSILLTWAIPQSLFTFQPGLDHRILYQCVYYEKKWYFGGLIRKVKNHTLSFELKGLKYAHALCDIRVSMRSALADENDESMWSRNATKTVRTESKVPDCPPLTNVGSFQIDDNVNHYIAYVYWQQLREEQKNGQNFTYKVEVENDPSITALETTKLTSYASFKVKPNTRYIINVWSVNEKGRSVEKSTVIIPAKVMGKPLNFVKYGGNENLYVLNWKAPQNYAVSTYTIFWCYYNNWASPYQCVENLNWEVVPSDQTKFNRTFSGQGIYRFAISANSPESSSGMLWADCTVIPNQHMSKIDSVWINRVDSTSMDIEWRLDCTSRLSVIKGYLISYCQIESPMQTSCKKTTEKNVTLEGGINVQSGRIEGLKPYTSYRLTVSYILNNYTYSQPSNPQRNTTREAPPSTPPLNVTVYDKTNSSISLRWEPPKQLNGMLREYKVYIDGGDGKKMVIAKENNITLTNLLSYHNYAISVEACTSNCSNQSDTIYIMTNMWSPGKINPPSVSYKNSSHIVISWEKPNPARGKIDYYQLNIREQVDEDGYPYIKTKTQNYSLEGCDSGKQSFYISVRAVNLINERAVEGPWSGDLAYSCTPLNSVIYILVGSFIVFCAIVVVCIIKKLYWRFEEDRKFKPTLPPDLQEIIDNWSSEKKDIERIPPTDAKEHLLHKSKEIRSSGDTSGCSSGHESLTGSIESTAHISPSDSGTEQPRSPSLSEASRKNSLRQRNVSAAPRPTTNMGYVTTDTISGKPAAAPQGSYCVLGVDPTSTTPESPCIPLTDLNAKLPLTLPCDLAQPPPPYVMTGDLLKNPNSGYVPYTEPTSDLGYVVAGLNKDLMECDTPTPEINEEKPLYIKAAESLPMLKQFPWQQPQHQLPKTGYVSVGDAAPPKPLVEVTKGYVPHRQFEGKALKED